MHALQYYDYDCPIEIWFDSKYASNVAQALISAKDHQDLVHIAEGLNMLLRNKVAIGTTKQGMQVMHGTSLLMWQRRELVLTMTPWISLTSLPLLGLKANLDLLFGHT